MKDMIYKDYAFFIIGNGFDLASNHDTAFKDYLQEILNNNEIDEYSLDFITFIHYVYKKYESINNRIEFHLNDNNWADIEKSILTMENEPLINTIQEKIYVLKSNNRAIKTLIDTNTINEENLSFHICKDEYSTRDIKLILYVLKHYKNGFSSNNFLEEINRFENAFKEYLNRIFSANNSNNEIKSKNLFNKLSEGFRSGIIFNFNYTNTLDTICSKNFEVRHVHGTLKDQIIIGVDLTKVKNAKQISKTYRVLDLKKDVKLDVLPSIPKEIVFFGHSLNEQDYSYFQSIFDHVNLYSSNVRLTFYYSDYEKNGKEFYRQKERVIKLIETYGKTLDNKDHGRNLLHKLLIEERIVFKEI